MANEVSRSRLPGALLKALGLLGIGTAGQRLRVNAGATALEYESGWETIEVANMAAVSEYTKTGLSAFRELRLRFALTVSVDGVTVALRTSSNNGVSYDSGAGDYQEQYVYNQGSSIVGGGLTSSGIELYASNVGNAANKGVWGVAEIDSFNQAVNMPCRVDLQNLNNAGTHYGWLNRALRLQATARNAVRVAPASGTISGRIILEGIRG